MTDLGPLGRLVGEWKTEMTHPQLPSHVVRGETTFEWLEGELFLIQRSRTDHPDFPDSISVLGDTDGLRMHYFDSRGAHRVYEFGFEGGAWKIWRDHPGFSQRFTGNFDDDGNTIDGLWQLAEGDHAYADDLKITFRRSK